MQQKLRFFSKFKHFYSKTSYLYFICNTVLYIEKVWKNYTKKLSQSQICYINQNKLIPPPF